jgi:hypothetical protein
MMRQGNVRRQLDRSKGGFTFKRWFLEAIGRIQFELRRIMESNRLEGSYAFLKF